MLKYFHYLALFIFSTTVYGQGATPVRVHVITKEKILDFKNVTGSLRPALKSNIASLESGRIDLIRIKEGQTVSKGDMIAKLDNRRIIHDIEEVKAKANEIKSDIHRNEKELKIHLEDYNALADAEKSFKGSVSRQELREARLKTVISTEIISVLKSSLFILQAQLDRLQTSLTDTVIKAAFDGVITHKHVEIGAWVAAGDPVATIVNRHKLEAWLDIPETVPTKIISKDLVTVIVNQSPVSIKSIRIIPAIDERSRNYQLIAEIEGTDHSLLPGMSVDGTVPNGLLTEHLLIPFDAILRNGAGYFVFKVQSMPEGMVAIPVPLDIRFRTGTGAAVDSAMLKAGDQVITEGNERLFPMMPVTVLTGAVD